MPSRSPSRIVVITLTLIAFAAIAVSANWGGFGYRQPAAHDEPAINQESADTAAEPLAMTTPLNAITSFDAALIGRHVVALPPPFNADQLTVANVTGSGTITSFDAAYVARYVVNNGASAGSTGTVVPPGLLMGDVSGTGPHYDGIPGTVAVSLPPRNAGAAVVVPVTVGDLTGLGVVSYDFQVTFDPAVLQPTSPPVSYTGTMSELSTSVSWNANNPGHLIVSGWSFNPLTGSGTLLNLRFNAVGSVGQSTALTFEDYTDPSGRIHQSFLFNEGTPSVGTMTNGTVTLVAFTPTPTRTPTNTPTTTPTNTSTPTNTATPTPTPAALNAITTFDAALILRHVVELPPPFNADQMTVANVTGTGSISSLDVLRVTNYVVNSGNSGSTGTIVPPGLLMGDVSGAGPHYDGSPGTANASLPNMNAGVGADIAVVPITVEDVTGLGVVSFDFQVTFDPTVLQPTSQPTSTTGTLCGDGTGWNIFRNTNNPGHLIISGSSFNAFTGSGTLLNLRFNVVGSAGQSTALTFEDYTDPGSRMHQSFLFNEGTPSSTTTNGSVTLVVTTPTSTSTATPTSTPTNTATPVNPLSRDVYVPAQVSATPGIVTIPLNPSGIDLQGLNVIAYDFHLHFDPTVITPASPAFDKTGTLSEGMMINSVEPEPGHLIISAFTGADLTCCTALLKLRFNIVGSMGQSTYLNFENYTDPNNVFHPKFRFNDGTPNAITGDGTVRVSGTVSGNIKYRNAVGSPALRYIPGVTVDGGTPPPNAVFGVTEADGNYLVSGFLAGAYSLTPRKVGGVNGAITSFDAAKIAQHVAGMATLTSNQQGAADVSNTNGITSYDAGLIAIFVAGHGIDPGLSTTGIWWFSPSGRNYPFVITNITDQNYDATLWGDVSGNWMPSAARPAIARNGPERNADVEAPSLVTPTDKEISIPIVVRGAANKDVIAYEFDLRYDPSVIAPEADAVELTGTVSSGLSVVANAHEPGLLKVVVYGAMPIDSDGVLLNLRFIAVGKPGSVSALTWERIMFNEGEPGATATDGQVELSSAGPTRTAAD